MQFFTKHKLPDFQEWISDCNSDGIPAEPQYIAVPPDFSVINIGNNKFNQTRPPYKTKNQTHHYWSCNQRPECKASVITIKLNNTEYPTWAKYGIISSKGNSSIKHNHTPKWTLSHGIREWSINQMMIQMSLDASNKPRATINQFILDHPMKALQFQNINKYTQRLYQTRPSFHGVFPKSIEQIDEMCMKSKYSLTYHSCLMHQQQTSTKLNEENICNESPYHLEQTIEQHDIKQNKSLHAKYILKSRNQRLSIDRQNKIDEMYLGMFKIIVEQHFWHPFLKLLLNNIFVKNLMHCYKLLFDI